MPLQSVPRLLPLHGNGRDDRPGTQRGFNDDAACWLELTQRDSVEDNLHSTEWLAPEYPGLPERKTRRAEFQRVISYRAYRLRNRENSYDSTIADTIADMAKRLKPSMQCPFQW